VTRFAWLHCPDVWGVAGLLLVVTLAFRREVFLGRMLWIDDLATSFYPVRTYTAQVMRAGHFPLWTPYLWGGFPLFADTISAPLYPLHLLALPITAPLISFIALYVANVALAGLLMYGFVRAVGLKPLAAFVAGVTFMLGGFFVSQMNHMNVSATALWLPLQCWMLELCLRRGRLRYAAPGGLAVGVQILAGHSQVVLMSLLVLLTYGGLRSLLVPAPEFCARSGGGMRGAARRILYAGFALGCMAGLGLGLAAFQLLPFAELFALSGRAASGWGYRAATELSYPPLALVNLLFPYFFRLAPTERILSDWGWGFFVPSELYGYVGAAGLLLALAAVALPHARRRYAAWVALLAVIFLVVAMGHYTPLYRLVYALPGFHSARVPARFLYPFGFYTALLAGLGMHALEETARDRQRARVWVWAAAVSAPLLVGLVLLARWMMQANQPLVLNYLQYHFLALRDTVYTPPEQLVQYLLAALDLRRFDTAAPLILWGLSAAGLVGWYRASRPRVWLVGLAGLAALGSLYGADFYIRLPRSEVEARLQADTAALVERMPPDSLERVYSQLAPLTSNATLPYHLAQTSGYTLVRPVRLVEYFEQSAQNLCRSRLLDLWGVRYLWQEKAEAEQLLSAGCQYRLAYAGEQYDLLENLDPLPRAFLVSRVIAARDPADIVPTLLAVETDLSRVAATEGLDAAQFPGGDLSDAQVRITRYEDRVVEIETAAETSALLVLTDTFYPGWRATVDGQRSLIYRTDYWFRGVLLPAGQHRVRFEYDPLSFRIGIAITLVTLLATVCLLGFKRLRWIVIVGGVVGTALVLGMTVDWDEARRAWDESAALASRVEAQLQAQCPTPPDSLRFYFAGVPASPGPAYALSNSFLSKHLFERVYPGRGVTGSTQAALFSALAAIPPPWEGQPGLVAYWYADGAFALTPYVYSRATGERLVDMLPPAPAARPPAATFGGWLQLYGSAVITQAFDADGGRLGGPFLETDWQLRTPAGRRYTLYVHLTTPDGQIVAQADHALAVWTGRRGDVYTDEWPVGTLVRDYVVLPPEALDPASPLDIRIGAWIPETGERLPVASDTLPVDGQGRLILGQLAP
jgi:hypothetical protein